MAGISSIGQSIGKGIARATNSRPATWLGKKFEENPENALAMATVTSIVLKDGIGCAMYVTQSLNNKKIPDEKRKFVAALDLTNGVLMIAAQIAMFFAMRKYSGPIFEKLFAKSFNDKNKSSIISRMRMWLNIKNPGNTPKKLTLEKEYNDVKKDGLDLFKFVADIAAATIVGKRIIVPLIATPLAKKVEKRMNKDNAKAEEKTPSTETNENKNENIQIKGNTPLLTQKQYEEFKAPYFQNNQNSNLLNRYKR